MRTVELVPKEETPFSITIPEPVPQVIVYQEKFYIRDDTKILYIPLYVETTGVML